MPRGKKLTLEERLEQLDKDIKEFENRRDNIQMKIDALILSRDELVESAKRDEINKLIDAMKQSGKTTEDIYNFINAS